MLRRIIVGRLTVKPAAGGHYQFSGKGTVVPVLGGVVQNGVPTGNRRTLDNPNLTALAKL